MGKKNWTRDELLVALKIYCELEFRQFHSRHPRIVEVSKVIDRTPSALSMKLCNFASLDPAVEGKGLTKASSADRKIMETFLEFPET
ncbi:MAG: HNH endonuclease, partial [Alphaproteobacteria bacterium]|nr:HNH endonuclease [Alphaproteobacteria bacterium]